MKTKLRTAVSVAVIFALSFSGVELSSWARVFFSEGVSPEFSMGTKAVLMVILVSFALWRLRHEGRKRQPLETRSP